MVFYEAITLLIRGHWANGAKHPGGGSGGMLEHLGALYALLVSPYQELGGLSGHSSLRHIQVKWVDAWSSGPSSNISSVTKIYSTLDLYYIGLR
jgi:hypothetical protein